MRRKPFPKGESLMKSTKINKRIAPGNEEVDHRSVSSGRFLNPESSYERILMAPPCRLIFISWRCQSLSRVPKKMSKKYETKG
jgi:hypothetical protein